MHGPPKVAMILAWISTTIMAGTPAVAAEVRGVPPGPGGIWDPQEFHDTLDRAKRDRDFCSRTADAALQACRNEIQDEYWTSFGKCLNLGSAGQRDQCLLDAEAALAEGQALCAEQLQAREAVCGRLGQDPYDPNINPSRFLSPAQAAASPHPYYPLVPGTTWRYVGGGETVDITVTDQIKVVLGVACFVVKDVARVNGVVIEDTEDFYAMDRDGNVWYLGEHSETWEEGELVSLDGSWRAGVDGARAGIIMKAVPQVADMYRQEFLLGDAEDLAEVLSVTATESVPAASCDGNCLVTRDFTPVEPGSEEYKYYAAGVGMMLEVNPEDGVRLELTDYHPGSSPNPRRAIPSSARGAGMLSEVRVLSGAAPAGSGSLSEIRFDLGRDADVNVDVYDSAGRRIRSVFTGRREAGSHAFQWPGTDEDGKRVASGIYFVRVRAGAESSTGRIVILAR